MNNAARNAVEAALDIHGAVSFERLVSITKLSVCEVAFALSELGTKFCRTAAGTYTRR